MSANNINQPAHSEDLTELNVSAIETLSDALIGQFYDDDFVQGVVLATLKYINQRIQAGLVLPYFADITYGKWQSKPKTLDIYVTDTTEGRTINLEARGKDYATNVLSYPSDVPASIIELMPMIPLGELIICHEVIVAEAKEQNKTVPQHITHLLIHGVLHLVGFDHELGQVEQDEMEAFEIDILASLALPNPYF